MKAGVTAEGFIISELSEDEIIDVNSESSANSSKAIAGTTLMRVMIGLDMKRKERSASNSYRFNNDNDDIVLKKQK